MSHHYLGLQTSALGISHDDDGAGAPGQTRNAGAIRRTAWVFFMTSQRICLSWVFSFFLNGQCSETPFPGDFSTSHKIDTKKQTPPPIAQPASVAGWQSKQKLFETSTPLSSSWYPGVASDIMWLSYFCWNQNKSSSLIAWSFKKFNRLILSCHQFYLQLFQSLRMFNRSRRGSRIRESNKKKLEHSNLKRKS